MRAFLVLNGPNLNLLGQRQPDIYGRTTLADIEAMCRAHGEVIGVTLDFVQSNHEGVLIDAIHEARGRFAGLIVNAGAYTHSSIALMDALISAELPAVEVHLSNIHAREPFRHRSYISRAALGQICGFGARSYILAMDALDDYLGREG